MSGSKTATVALALTWWAASAAAQVPGTEFSPGNGPASVYVQVASSAADVLASRGTAVFDDGGGDALYVVGNFAAAGDVDAPGVARWRAGHWEPVGSIASVIPGTQPPRATALAVFDPGTGPKLYAAYRRFDAVANLWRAGVAAWNGAAWSTEGPEFTVAVAAGQPAIEPEIMALSVADLGGGPKLYAGGRFNRVGALIAVEIAVFDGVAWNAAGGGLGVATWSGVNTTTAPYVAALAASSAGGPTKLYAGGAVQVNGVNASLAAYDGATWSAIAPTGFVASKISALCAFDDGAGEKLYVGGDVGFSPSGPVPGVGLLTYDGVAFQTPATLTPPCCPTAPAPVVRALGVRQPAGGPAELVVGGDFYSVNGAVAGGLARNTGGVFGPFPGWTDVASLKGAAPSFAEFDDGDGPRFYYGVTAAFDGATWASVDRRSAPFPLLATGVLDVGDGPRIFGGTDGANGGVSIYRRDGVAWSRYGATSSAWQPTSNEHLWSMAVFDEGAGPRLFLGGRFLDISSAAPTAVPMIGLLRFDGTTFSTVGAPGNVAVFGSFFNGAFLGGTGIMAVATGNIGAGPRLYVGGSGQFLDTVRSWDGATWSILAGCTNSGGIRDMVVFDDGTGSKLYAGGGQFTIGGQTGLGVVRWNGASWSGVGSLIQSVNDLHVFDDGTGPHLYAATGAGTGPSVWKLVGGSWVPVGSPFSLATLSLETYDDASGGGPTLYAAGSTQAFLPAAPNGLARLVGGVWNYVPGLAWSPSSTPTQVARLTAAPDVDGPALYLFGNFLHAGPYATIGSARMAPIVPKIDWTQSGPGAPISYAVTDIGSGCELFNLFSFETAAPFGLGPYLGLYAPDPASLVLQASVALGTEPFHVAPTGGSYVLGPVVVPAGLKVDAAAVGVGAGHVAVSRVERLTVR
jgi:hypothetical protein